MMDVKFVRDAENEQHRFALRRQSCDQYQMMTKTRAVKWMRELGLADLDIGYLIGRARARPVYADSL